MKLQPEQWQMSGLREHFAFVHHTMEHHRYAWVLGAGASVSSSIPSAVELVDEWLKDICKREAPPDSLLEEWATPAQLGIDKFSFADRTAFYPQIYQRRFRDHPEEGYAYLENLMRMKDPGPGYSLLAKILETTRHKVVVTTNFDNLVEDALAIYTDTFPFVCGHESLVGFIGASISRPLVCKIHRDLLLGPQNDARSLRRLHDSWGAKLRMLFQSFTPIFIGYGGNDDTLMDLLESLEPGEIKGRLIWCYYQPVTGPNALPKERIQNLVAQHHGVLVGVPDFDLLMVCLAAAAKIELLDLEIERRARERAHRYRERIIDLDTKAHPEVRDILVATYKRVGWSAWEAKANEQTDSLAKLQIYERAASLFCENSEFNLRYACFLDFECRDPEKAEKYYRDAYKLNHVDPEAAGLLAYILERRERYDEAEGMYKRAIKLDSSNAMNVSNYGRFLANVRGKREDAITQYEIAHNLSKGDPDITLDYAIVLGCEPEGEAKAENLYRMAIFLAPQNASAHAQFAKFLSIKRGDHIAATASYQNAIACSDGSEKLSCQLELAAMHMLQNEVHGAFDLLNDTEHASRSSIEDDVRWALYDAVIHCAARASAKPDEDEIVRRRKLQDLLRAHFDRSPAEYDHAAQLIKNLPSDSRQSYELLLRAVQDEYFVEVALQQLEESVKPRKRRATEAAPLISRPSKGLIEKG